MAYLATNDTDTKFRTILRNNKQLEKQRFNFHDFDRFVNIDDGYMKDKDVASKLSKSERTRKELERKKERKRVNLIPIEDVLSHSIIHCGKNAQKRKVVKAPKPKFGYQRKRKEPNDDIMNPVVQQRLIREALYSSKTTEAIVSDCKIYQSARAKGKYICKAAAPVVLKKPVPKDEERIAIFHSGCCLERKFSPRVFQVILGKKKTNLLVKLRDVYPENSIDCVYVSKIRPSGPTEKEQYLDCIENLFIAKVSDYSFSLNGCKGKFYFVVVPKISIPNSKFKLIVQIGMNSVLPSLDHHNLFHLVENVHEYTVSHKKCLFKRLSANCDNAIRCRDEFSRSYLHYACRSIAPETVVMLLKIGLDPNCQDNDNRTPLMYLLVHHCNTNYGEACSILTSCSKKNMNVNLIDRKDRSLLDYCARYDFGGELTRIVMKAGADPNVRNYLGRVPLDTARFFRNKRFEKQLNQLL